MKAGKVLTPMAIVGYRFLNTPTRPDLKVLEIVTFDGEFRFVGTKGVLLRLAVDLKKTAETLTADRGAN